MRFHSLDLNLFLVFDVVYREQNLSRAADILHITQPAVSNALQRLRDRLGDQLFYRVAGGVAPTPAAQSMIEPVRQALSLFDLCIQQTIGFEPRTSKHRFTLGLGDLGEAIFMPRLLQLMHKEGPDLSVQSVSIPRRELAEALIFGNIDLAIDTPFLNDPQINGSPLVNDEYICLLRPKHPALNRTWNLDNFLQLEHVHPSSRRVGAGMIDNALTNMGKARRIAFRVQHYMVAPEIVRQTDLVLCVPSMLARLFPDLKVKPLPFASGKIELNVYTRKNAGQYAATSWLLEKVLSLANAVE